jgi:hypothetical protein
VLHNDESGVRRAGALAWALLAAGSAVDGVLLVSDERNLVSLPIRFFQPRI